MNPPPKAVIQAARIKRVFLVIYRIISIPSQQAVLYLWRDVRRKTCFGAGSYVPGAFYAGHSKLIFYSLPRRPGARRFVGMQPNWGLSGWVAGSKPGGHSPGGNTGPPAGVPGAMMVSGRQPSTGFLGGVAGCQPSGQSPLICRICCRHGRQSPAQDIATPASRIDHIQ